MEVEIGIADESEVDEDDEDEATQAAEEQPLPNGNESAASAAAVLIGIFCVKFALSQRAIKALLELLKLNLDVSSINGIQGILNAMDCAPMNVHSSCRNCHADLDLSECFEEW